MKAANQTTDSDRFQAIEIQRSAHQSNLYIFFGGIAAGIGIPVFEFYNSAKIMNDNKIFVRDFSQCWYQNGLTGISSDIHSTADYLKKKIEEIAPEKLFFVGNSMGGYAAILFAALIGKGEVIAFAPQTFISPLLRFKHGDNRWRSQILRTHLKCFFKSKIWDLRRLLSRLDKELKISIFAATDHQLDMIHALHLKGILGVEVHEFKEGGHGVVKAIRNKGILHAIMTGIYVNS